MVMQNHSVRCYSKGEVVGPGAVGLHFSLYSRIFFPVIFNLGHTLQSPDSFKNSNCWAFKIIVRPIKLQYLRTGSDISIFGNSPGDFNMQPRLGWLQRIRKKSLKQSLFLFDCSHNFFYYVEQPEMVEKAG